MDKLERILGKADLVCVSEIEGHVPAYPYLDYGGKRYSFREELTKTQRTALLAILGEPEEAKERMFEDLSQAERDVLMKEVLIEAGKLDQDGKVKKRK